MDNAYDGLDAPSRAALAKLLSQMLTGFSALLVQDVPSGAEAARSQALQSTHRAEEVLPEVARVSWLGVDGVATAPTPPELGAAPAMAASMACGVATSMALETWVLKVWEGFASWTTAFSTAANMSLISMLSMEGAENAVSYYATGGDICSEHFFAFLPASLAAGFLTPLPYNYFMLRKHGRACH